ncbi:MAG: hypothetical protein GY788_04140 [bacterium]|nr:hypothetical protein [bacterium]
MSSCSGGAAPPSTAALTTLPPVTTTSPPTTTSPAPPPTLPPSPPAGLCRSYGDPEVLGTVASAAITETSGIAVSRMHPETVWLHNDSGGGAVVYASTFAGADIGAFEIDAPAFDWEDMAIGPSPEPGSDYLYLGDIGDNLHFRSAVSVYRILEPTPDTAGGTVTDVVRFDLAYPDPGYDSESLLVDPVTGDLLIVTKPSGGDPALIFRAPASQLREGTTIDLVPVGSFPLESGTFVTSADIDGTGNVIVFRGYNEVWLWERQDLEFAATFAAEPCRTPSTAEVQGEAIAFLPDRYSYITISEGPNPDINLVASIFD